MAREPHLGDDYVLNEIHRLREWRHDVVTPQLLALAHRHEILGGLVERLNVTVAEIGDALNNIAKRDEIQEAVSQATKAAVQAERQHWLDRIALPWRILLAVVGLLVAVSAVGSFVLRLLGL